MSLELRTPLNAIIGYSEMLQEGVEELEQTELLPDLTKVRQSLLNLLSNAAKFTENGTIILTVEREAEANSRGEKISSAPLPLRSPAIIFSVADTGIGLKPEQMTRLFQAFSQGDASINRNYGGTGLGLAISRHYCRMIGGDITVVGTCIPGDGSTFTIRLPVEAQPLTIDR